MYNLNTHYQKITAMCYLLNGKDNSDNGRKHYSCGFHSYDIWVKPLDGRTRVVHFQKLYFNYKTLFVKFNQTEIALNMVVNGDDWGDEFEFATNAEREFAEKVFGKGVSPNSIVVFTEQALKGMCTELAKELNEIISCVN